ncbi:MAG: helix-turn-helix domain-containing protein [Planctomycetaceae bacterium]
MSSTLETSTAAADFRRDDKGRAIAADGLPITGNAHAKEAAIIGGVCVSTIYEMMANGTLDSVKFGRARRIPWASVRSVLLQRHGTADAESCGTTALVETVIALHQICTATEDIGRRVRCSVKQVDHIIEFGCLDPD